MRSQYPPSTDPNNSPGSPLLETVVGCGRTPEVDSVITNYNGDFALAELCGKLFYGIGQRWTGMQEFFAASVYISSQGKLSCPLLSLSRLRQVELRLS